MENLILQEKYLLEDKLQEGKFGSTYLARDAKTNKKYIVKYVLLKKSDLINKVPLLEHEAKIIANLQHPQIPKFIDFFSDTNDENVQVYFVQEYIESKNLQQLIEERYMEFNETQIIKIALSICNILKYIHSFSPAVIHQDIKPANILYSKDEKVYLIDFGAVKQKIISVDEAGLSTIIGTHGYMPIEQFEGRAVKGSDIYSLGLTLLYMITKKEPLTLDKKGLKFDLKNLAVSEKFKNVLEKMLEPDWKIRYQNCRELEEDLLAISENNKLNLIQNQKIYNMIKSELADNEKLKWYGKTNNNLLGILSNEFHIFKIALVMSFFGLLASGHSIFLIFFLIFTISAIILFLNYLENLSLISLNYLSLLKETYIITDQRIIVIQKGFNKSTTKTFNNSDIKEVRIYEKLSRNRGNMLVTRKSTFESFKMKYLDNADLVYKILNEIKDKND